MLPGNVFLRCAEGEWLSPTDLMNPMNKLVTRFLREPLMREKHILSVKLLLQDGLLSGAPRGKQLLGAYPPAFFPSPQKCDRPQR